MTIHKIPGGKKKGTPIDQAEVSDLDYWLTRITGELAANPQKEFADRDRALTAAMSAELQRRKAGGTKAPATAAPAPAPKSQALAKAEPGSQALAGSWNDVSIVDAELRKASQEMHLVSPATTCGSLPEGCEVAISLVYVDPDDSKSGPGEVYSVGNSKFGLAAAPLKRIWGAAGGDWDLERSGRLDSGREPLYVHFRAVGSVLNFDGSSRKVSGEVELDLRDDSPQVAAMRARAGTSNFDSQLRDMRLFILRHAETKAKERAVCDMGVKRSYTAAELQKPFAVARLMATGRTRDPALREKFATMNFERMLNRGQAVYGRSSARPALPQRPVHEFVGHEPPPVGAARLLDEPLDDEPWGYDDIETKAESVGEAVGQPVGEQAPAPAAAASGQTPLKL